MTDREHEAYADWDGAYVMGALTLAERRAYEEHLADCPRCADAVAELGPLPGLLGRLAPEDAEPLIEEAEEVPERLLAPAPGPVAVLAPAARRRHRRVRLALAGLAAAAVVAVAIPVTLHATGDRPDETVALRPTATSPLTASVSLTAMSWGTRIDLTCTYAGSYGAQRAYGLYVIGVDGRATLVSRWHAGPGDTAKTVGSTDLSLSAIGTLQLRAADGAVLLSGSVLG